MRGDPCSNSIPVNGRINGSNAILYCSSLIYRQFIPGKRPYVVKRNQKLTPIVIQHRRRRIDTQNGSQCSQTPAIALCIDELLNHAE
jgi:hypothetical protein